jgi:hypothetical protein
MSSCWRSFSLSTPLAAELTNDVADDNVAVDGDDDEADTHAPAIGDDTTGLPPDLRFVALADRPLPPLVGEETVVTGVLETVVGPALAALLGVAAASGLAGGAGLELAVMVWLMCWVCEAAMSWLLMVWRWWMWVSSWFTCCTNCW